MNDELTSIKDEIEKSIVYTYARKIRNFMFDLRPVLLDSRSLDMIANIFWERYSSEYPFQVGGQEISAIPLTTAIILKGQSLGKPVNGFFIRKSRKPTDLQKIIEGKLGPEKIILVDDLINSGTTILRQAEVLKNINRNIYSVFTLVNFRGKINERMVAERGATLKYLFTLEDFGLSLPEPAKPPKRDFEIIWKFQSPSPNYAFRVSKSTPCLSQGKLYFGSDSDFFWALNQQDGSIEWKFKTGFVVIRNKSIFSSPAVQENLVFFGSYDGNMYALDKHTGQLRWTYEEADFIGSSPAIASDLGVLFIGLEFGLIKKQGGIAALNLRTGKEAWKYTIEGLVHCSPAYCPEKRTVAVGSNDASVYVFDAKSGKLKWKFKTGGEIKASLAFDVKHNLLLFGSLDKSLYALDIDSGEIKGKVITQAGVCSTPLIYQDTAFFSSIDKNIYAVDLETGKLKWRFATDGRVFSSPTIIEEKIVVGSNDGRIYELDAQTGKCLSFFQATERITNPVVYNPSTKRYFVTTYANEIYCLRKKNTATELNKSQ